MACGRVDEPSPVTQEDATVIGGETDTGDPGVVAVYAQQPGSDAGFLCTGSVIAPTVILTAAHCVSPSETGRGATFTVLTSANINRGGGQQLAVREVHANPLWSTRNLAGGHDQGIVILGEPTSLPVCSSIARRWRPNRWASPCASSAMASTTERDRPARASSARS